MQTNISNLEICCLAYDKQFDQLKAKIDADPDCVKKKDRVRLLLYTYVKELYIHKFRMVVLFFIGLVQVVQKILFNIYLIFVIFDQTFLMR